MYIPKIYTEFEIQLFKKSITKLERHPAATKLYEHITIKGNKDVEDSEELKELINTKTIE